MWFFSFLFWLLFGTHFRRFQRNVALWTRLLAGVGGHINTSQMTLFSSRRSSYGVFCAGLCASTQWARRDARTAAPGAVASVVVIYLRADVVDCLILIVILGKNSWSRRQGEFCCYGFFLKNYLCYNNRKEMLLLIRFLYLPLACKQSWDSQRYCFDCRCWSLT